MAVVEGFQNLIDVEPDVIIAEAFIQSTEIQVTRINVFHYESRRLCHGIANNIYQVNNVNSATKSLQDLDLTSDLSFFHWFEDLDYDSLVVQCIDAFVNF